MAEQLTKNQHIVPKLYLNNFSIPDSENEVFARFRGLEGASPKPVSTDSICYRKNFYENPILTECVGPNFIEKTVNGLYEGRYKEFLRETIANGLNLRHRLSIRDKRALAKFIAYQYLRTSRCQAFIDVAHEQDAPASRAQPLSAAHAAILLDTWNGEGQVQGLQEFMLQRNWAVVVNAPELTGGYFYTSDNPVCVINASADFPEGNLLPIIQPASSFYFPLSPRVALLLLTIPIRSAKVVMTSRDMLERLNNLVYQQSDCVVVSNQADFSLLEGQRSMNAREYKAFLSELLPDIKAQVGSLFG